MACGSPPARLGLAQFGTARLESARFVSARLGSARRSSARPGSARLGSARARSGSARLGSGSARPGSAKLGPPRLGSARLGSARLGFWMPWLGGHFFHPPRGRTTPNEHQSYIYIYISNACGRTRHRACMRILSRRIGTLPAKIVLKNIDIQGGTLPKFLF